MTWILLALLGAFFTSMTTTLAKIGIQSVASNFAAFFRTGIVIVSALALCWITVAFSL